MIQTYPNSITYKDKNFIKKQCIECGSTFWILNKEINYCGNAACNNFCLVTDVNKNNLTLKETIKNFKNYFSEIKSDLYLRAHVLGRAKTAVKHSSSDMYYLCAGVSAYESLIDESNPRKEYFSKDLLISNLFCFRFLDKKNVELTGRHGTGFYMAGLHCFESQKNKFSLTWKQDWVNLLLGYFIKELKLDPTKLYLHADCWSDGVRSGPSVQFFYNGLQLGNLVFTEHNTATKEPLDIRFIDVGLGIERIHNLTSTTPTQFFNNKTLDCLRLLCISFKDGLFPSKIGVGYNLRKLAEQVLKSYKSDLPGLISLVEKTICLLNELTEETFNKEHENLVINILMDELKRCKLSNII